MCRFEYIKNFGNIKFIYKILNGHLNFLLSEEERDIQKIKSNLVRYHEFNSDERFFGT
jgi:hypothetical protein